jgi:hypothetical protein
LTRVPARRGHDVPHGRIRPETLVIACPRCGWAACVAQEHENSVWQTHLAGTACVDVIPLRTKNPSPYRARLCIQGHERDILGICWTCLSRGAGS